MGRTCCIADCPLNRGERRFIRAMVKKNPHPRKRMRIKSPAEAGAAEGLFVLLLATTGCEFFLGQEAVLILVLGGESRFGLGGILGARDELIMGDLAVAVLVLLGEHRGGILLGFVAFLLFIGSERERSGHEKAEENAGEFHSLDCFVYLM